MGESLPLAPPTYLDWRLLGEEENQEMGESLPLAPPTYLDWILWNHHLWWLQNENSVRPPELTHSLSRKCGSKIKIKIFQIRGE